MTEYKFGKQNLSDKTYLRIQYENKEEAKRLGAKWDSINKEWYVIRGDKYFDFLVNLYDKRLFMYDGSSKKYIREFRSLKEYLTN